MMLEGESVAELMLSVRIIYCELESSIEPETLRLCESRSIAVLAVHDVTTWFNRLIKRVLNHTGPYSCNLNYQPTNHCVALGRCTM
jgi:hypothetical protein